VSAIFLKNAILQNAKIILQNAKRHPKMTPKTPDAKRQRQFSEAINIDFFRSKILI